MNGIQGVGSSSLPISTRKPALHQAGFFCALAPRGPRPTARPPLPSARPRVSAEAARPSPAPEPRPPPPHFRGSRVSAEAAGPSRGRGHWPEPSARARLARWLRRARGAALGTARLHRPPAGTSLAWALVGIRRWSAEHSHTSPNRPPPSSAALACPPQRKDRVRPSPSWCPAPPSGAHNVSVRRDASWSVASPGVKVGPPQGGTDAEDKPRMGKAGRALEGERSDRSRVRRRDRGESPDPNAMGHAAAPNRAARSRVSFAELVVAPVPAPTAPDRDRRWGVV